MQSPAITLTFCFLLAAAGTLRATDNHDVNCRSSLAITASDGWGLTGSITQRLPSRSHEGLKTGTGLGGWGSDALSQVFVVSPLTVGRAAQRFSLATLQAQHVRIEV